jgi:glyoxylase-like metal-dependent hydrolase (beta-lactamase superfamily II)
LLAAAALASLAPQDAAAAGEHAPAAAGHAVTVDLKPVEVAPGIWFVQGEAAMGSAANQNFISNAAFVIADGGVLVVDSLGSPPLAERLLAEIRQRTPLPIKYVVATHYHADHIYGLQVLKAAGAQIVAHEGALDYIHSDTARLRLEASREELFPWVDEHTRVVEPDLWVRGDQPMALRIGTTRFVLHHVGPSHTDEDLAVHMPDAGVLFAGDLVFRGRIPFVGKADSRAWVAAIDRVMALQPRLMLTGHGAVSTDPAGDLRFTRDYLSYLRETMGQAARDLDPFDEAYAKVDWTRFAGVPLFAAVNRMNAYNTYLLMEAEKP